MSLTKLEKKVYDYIAENANMETMECVDINDLANGLNESPKVLRGVVASLVKKELVEVEEWDANNKMQHFYWPKGTLTF
jgi:DNA-binding IscR family transcriptional regulator